MVTARGCDVNEESMGAWDLGAVERPWRGGPSILAHIQEHLSPDGQGLLEGGHRLPDENDDGSFKWMDGALDGAFGHHVGGGADKDLARMLHRVLGVVLQDATPGKLAKLYELLVDGAALEFVDPLLQLIVEKRDLDAERLEELAVWLATHSPDREPVKVAIALLGVMSWGDHGGLLLTLGRHEEFTLYVAVALSNLEGEAAEPELFQLARHVHGWGRIHLVERLARTTDAAIKAWMLREGYKNRIMYEYLAYTCATTGGLRDELEKDCIDPELLRGAGDIVEALLIGGPAEDIDDYADGAAVVERYLHHLGPQPEDLGCVVVVRRIQRFLDEEEADWTTRAGRGWTTALRAALRAKVVAVKEQPYWKAMIEAGLGSTDHDTFEKAYWAAKVLGIDTWDHSFARLEAGEDTNWLSVMLTEDIQRFDRAVALAERVIHRIHHGELQLVLPCLRGFPGKGWPLIRAGIRSPVVLNRRIALRALSAWDKGRWPTDAEGILKSALEQDSDSDVRDEIELLLAGKEIP